MLTCGKTLSRNYNSPHLRVMEEILSQDSSKIAQVIDRLDTPDADIQRSVMNELVRLGSNAVPTLVANLSVVNLRIRRGLVQVLGEIGDARALLPLMRYVFDRRGKHEEADARALAMKSIIALTDGPDDRVFEFATDMVRDSDAFVRAFTVDLFVALNERRGLPYIKDSLEDAEEIVRVRASLALPKLTQIQRSDRTVSGEELVEKILRSRGNQREFYLQELLDRPDAFSLAAALVRVDSSESTAGLRALQQIDDPRARKVAGQALLRPLDISSAQRAIGLRIIARYLSGDATAEETQIIERGLYDEDRLVRLAALQAAGRSGVQSLLRNALNALQTGDVLTALTVAESLSRAPFPAQPHLFSTLDNVLTNTRARRISGNSLIKNQRSEDAEDQVRLEAFLLRTMANILENEMDPAVHARAQTQAFNSLQSNPVTSTNMQPIYITALEILDHTTSNMSASLNTATKGAWHLSEILFVLNAHASLDSERARHRARQILKRVVPQGCQELVPYLQQWRRDPKISIVDDIIVLLERAHSDDSVKILEELARDPVDAVRESASAVLRRWRNNAPYIDVDFENSLKDSDE